MISLRTPAILLGATALTVPLAFGSAVAQQQQSQQAQQQATADGACQQLYQLVQQSEAAGEQLLEEFRDAGALAESQDAEACVLMIEKVESAGGITAEAQERGQGARVATDSDVDTETKSFTARDRVSQTVEIEQEAVVEGEVLVRQPIPEIGIEQGAPQIDVAQDAVDVNIQEQPAEIRIKQAPANVRVQIPQPSIMIEQPAPEIVITMPPPGVSLDRQQPKVSVNIPEPNVTVSQADPEVTADVQARFVSPDEATRLAQEGGQPQIATRTERLNASGQPADAQKTAEVTVRRSDAQVSIQPPQDQGKVRVQAADPRVLFEPAEPNVEVSFAENADVQIRQVGEPTVRIEREGGEQQAAMQQPAQGQQQPDQGQQQPEQAAAAQQQGQADFNADVEAVEGEEQQAAADATRMSAEDTNRLLGLEEGAQVGANAQMVEVTASDLVGHDVHTLRGEEVGEIEGFAQSGGQLYAIVSHGGFLGIGENKIAVPAERIAVQGDQVVLLGLSEEQLEQMPEYDFEHDQEMAGTDTVQIGRYE